MKTLILLILVAVFFTSCKTENDINNNNNNIVVKGEIYGTNKVKVYGMKQTASSLLDAKKILVINVHVGTLSSKFVDIINGSFADTAQIGIATSLVFLGENNKYIGTLSSQGLNLFPLCNLSNGEKTIIDLASLTLMGTSIIPSHDPFGNEIIIKEAELNNLKQIDGFFESLAKNIDSDNDGFLDVLSNKQLFIKTRFYIPGGQYGLNNSIPVISENVIDNIGYSIDILGGQGFSLPSSIVLSGPEDNPYNDITTYFINPDGNGGFYSGIWRKAGQFSSKLPFKKGTYTLTIDGNIHTLDYSNIDATQNLMIVIPTLHTNNEGKLVSISFEYKLTDNTTIDPVNILTDVGVQLSDSIGNQFYTSPKLINMYANVNGCGSCVKGLFSYTLSTPLDISALKNVSVSYNDLLGNLYAANWNK